MFGKTVREMVSYMGSSAVSALVNFVIYVAVFYGAEPVIGIYGAVISAGVSSRGISSLVNFALNRKIFMGMERKGGKRPFFRYYTLWSILLVFSIIITYCLTVTGATGEVAAKVIADCSLGVCGYLVQKKWVFAKDMVAEGEKDKPDGKGDMRTTIGKKGVLFKIVKGFAVTFLGKEVVIPSAFLRGGSVFVGLHLNFRGSVNSLLFLPDTTHVWAISHLFKFSTCFDMYCNHTFRKYRYLPRPLAVIAALVCGAIIPAFLKSAGCVPVYRGSVRIRETVAMSMELLEAGHQLVIFPDVDYKNDSERTGEIYGGFLKLERYYKEKTGKDLAFVPLIFSGEEKCIFAGDPLRLKDDISLKERREKIQMVI